MDLIDTQSGTLYDKILNANQPSFTISPPPSSRDSHAGDGAIGYLSTQMAGRPSGQTLAITNQTTSAPDNTLTSKINVMSSDKGKNEKQLGGKKKGKNKKKQNNSPQEKSSDSSSSARKSRYPCLICNNENFTRDCLHHSEVSKLMKNYNTSTVLTDPFPKSETNMVATDQASTSQVLMLSISKQKDDVLVTIGSKYYGNQPLSSNNQADQPNLRLQL